MELYACPAVMGRCLYDADGTTYVVGARTLDAAGKRIGITWAQWLLDAEAQRATVGGET